MRNLDQKNDEYLDNNTAGAYLVINMVLLTAVPTLIYLYAVVFKTENIWILILDELKWVLVGVVFLILLKIWVSKIKNYWSRNWISFVIGGSLLTFLSISVQVLEWYHGYNEISALHFSGCLILSCVIFYTFLNAPCEIYMFIYKSEHALYAIFWIFAPTFLTILLVWDWDTPTFWFYHIYHNAFLVLITLDLYLFLEGHYYIEMEYSDFEKIEMEKD